MKANLKASIISGNPADENKRITIRCRKDGDCFRWFGVDDNGEYDAGVSGATIKEAKNAARRAWSGPHWGFKANWSC